MRKSFKIKKIGISVAPHKHTAFLRHINSFDEKIIVIKCQFDNKFENKYYYHYDLVYLAYLGTEHLSKFGILYIPKF